MKLSLVVMMKRGIIIFMLLAMATLSFYNCNKDPETIIQEKEYNWKKMSFFSYDRAIQLNSYSTGDSLFILGPNGLNIITLNHIESSSPFSLTIGFSNTFPLQIYYKFPICKSYYVLSSERDGGFIQFDNIHRPFYRSDTYGGVNIKNIDTSFESFIFNRINTGESFSINDQNQTLIAYYAKNFKRRLLLFDIVTEGLGDIDTLKTTIIDLPEDNIALSIRKTFSFGKVFYILTDDKLFRLMDNDISIVLEGEYFYNMFEYQNSLYAVGGSNIFISNDGLSWNNYCTGNHGLYGSHCFININDKLVSYSNDKIFELSFDGAGIKNIELDNDGLNGCMISSVNKIGDYVVVTTLSGVYYKHINDFFEEKTEEK